MGADWDLIVIGGGISGLTLAYCYARAGKRVMVLEAASRPGGCINTAPIRVGAKEYWLELGAHTLFNSYATLLRLIPTLDLRNEILWRRRLPYRLFQDGKVRSIVGALHWTELARHLPHALWQKREGRRVVDYFSAVAGSRNYAQVIGPALDGLMCQPAEEFPAVLLLKHRNRDPAYPRSFSFRRGLTTLPESIASQLEVRRLRTVEQIEYSDGTYACSTESETITGRRLALAVPVAEAARLLGAIAQSLAQEVAAIPMASVDSTAIALRADSVQLELVAGLVARDASFYSVVSRDVIPHPFLRGFTFHFRTGMSEGKRLATMANVLGVDPSEFVGVVHAHHRLPQLRLGHTARTERVQTLLQGRSLALAGNYFGGLGIEECVTRAEYEARRLLSGN